MPARIAVLVAPLAERLYMNSRLPDSRLVQPAKVWVVPPSSSVQLACGVAPGPGMG